VKPAQWVLLVHRVLKVKKEIQVLLVLPVQLVRKVLLVQQVQWVPLVRPELLAHKVLKVIQEWPARSVLKVLPVRWVLQVPLVLKVHKDLRVTKV